MKKLAGVLLSLVLCLTLSVGAFAVEAQVDDKLIADIVDGVGDLVEAESEGDDEAMKQAIDKLYSDLQLALQSGDMSAILDLIVEYALNEDADTSAVFTDLGALKAVVEKFLTDGGYDADRIMKDLQSSSAMSTLVGLYTGGNEPTTTTTAPTAEGENPVVNEFQPVVENPGTGDSPAGVAVAFSVLAVSTAAVILLTKKKDR